MFDSREDALEFRSELIQHLDTVETNGWHVSPRLDGAHIHLGAGVARVRGHLDGQGYTVHDTTTDEIEAEGWAALLEVKP